MSFPDLCCSRKLVVRRLLVLADEYPGAFPFFSEAIVLPPTHPESAPRERRVRAVRVAALRDLVPAGVVEEAPDLEGVYRLNPRAADFYREKVRHPRFTEVRG